MSTRRRSTAEALTQSSSSKCHLCSSDSPANTYKTPATWTEESREWVRRYVPDLPLEVLVCGACSKFVKRHTGEEDVTPRWVKQTKTPHPCMVVDCKVNARGTTSLTTYSTAKEYLELDECAQHDTPLFLCNVHYQRLYHDLTAPTPVPCATCGGMPKYGKHYVRRCPDPERITVYLQSSTDFRGTITSDSRVCRTCYDFHSRVLKQREENPSLESVKSDLEMQIARFDQNDKQAVTDEQYLAWLVQRVALVLAKVLESEEAILLPELHSKFCSLIKTTASLFPAVSSTIVGNPPTTTWLLGSISAHFKGTLGVVCKHRKYGTLLYRKDGDLLKALSKALGNATGIAREAAAQHELTTERSSNKANRRDASVRRQNYTVARAVNA